LLEAIIAERRDSVNREESRWSGARRRLLLRISAQAYNEPEDYERLASALRRLGGAAHRGSRV